MKIKIAVIGLKGLPAFGGAATVGENIIENLKDKFEFTVYSTSSHTNLKTGTVNGYKQIVFKKFASQKLNSLFYYILSAFHCIFRAKYDLVHLHHRDASFIIPILRIRYKVILTTHGMVLTKKWEKYSWFFKIQDKFFLKMANTITCVSKKDRDIVKTLIPEKKVIHVPNGVDIKNDVSTIKNIYKICFAAGRIVPDKGCHILLEALIKIGYKESLLIIGDIEQMPSYKNTLSELAKSLPGIQFLGLIKEKNTLHNYIACSELFIYPSLIESMSMMLLEVASLKTPILCSDIRENRDIFNDNEVLYFKPNNIADLSEKIIWALNNPVQISNYSNGALKKIQINNNWQDISKKYEEIYNRLIQ